MTSPLLLRFRHSLVDYSTVCFHLLAAGAAGGWSSWRLSPSVHVRPSPESWQLEYCIDIAVLVYGRLPLGFLTNLRRCCAVCSLFLEDNQISSYA